MKIILSPAKKQKPADEVYRMDRACLIPPLTEPLFWEKSRILTTYLAALSPAELATAMRINDELAMQTYIQYQQIDAGQAVKTPALWSYVGLAYQNLKADQLSAAALTYACRQVRILDALYGVLRPTDGIYPYRLDMLAKIKPNGQNLYRFWQDDWAKVLMEGETILINLASNEFSKAVIPYLPASVRVVQVEFKTFRKGKPVVPTTLAKMARGAMVRFLCERQATSIDEMREFSEFDLRFRADLSETDRLVFVQ
ncbi:MAG: peroxide stress protein YaaA [Eubacteriales bacterium]|nr:peroxide stress protein YaaA [Eubacteriales bacterium]